MTHVVDTPEGIEAVRLITTLKGLELEIRWGATGVPTRGMALASARRILAQYGRSVPRTRKQALEGMKSLVDELGLLKD